MMKMILKLLKLIVSGYILWWMVSILPQLGNYVTVGGLLGFVLGVFYVKDPTGRYHYGWDGRYVSTEEDLCLKCILPILGIVIPMAITVYSLPLYALNELLAATFGSELVGLLGGMWLME